MKLLNSCIAKVLSAVLCISLIVPASAAAPQSNTSVKPLNESDVADYIEAATETHDEVLNGETVTYYFGENFGVAKDSTGYYLAKCGGDPLWISVNGRMLEIQTTPTISPGIDLPTPWSTVIDTGYKSVDIAGLSTTAAGLAIQLLMASIPGGEVAGDVFANAIENLGYKILPDGYYATIHFVSKSRIIEIHPTVVEFKDTLTVHMGPGNNKFKHLLINNHDTHTRTLDD